MRGIRLMYTRSPCCTAGSMPPRRRADGPFHCRPGKTIACRERGLTFPPMLVTMVRRTQAPTAGPTSAQLAWVIVDGEPHHVSEFAALPPRRRPHARCPECGELLVLKLGEVRVHHAAHKPDSPVCAATNPETALHLNLKYHIARELMAQAGRAIGVVTPCADAPCAETNVHAWPEARWTGVDVERRVGVEHMRRPDIVVLDGDRPVAAVEVLVSHAVDREKASALASLRIPWIEVRGDPALLDGAGWRRELPLPVHRRAPMDPWRCAAHAEAEGERIEAARHTTDVYAARLVDVYRPSGNWTRSLILVRDRRTDGVVVGRSLLFDGVELARGADVDLRKAYHEWKSRIAETGGIVDTRMDWAKGGDAARLVDEVRSDTMRGPRGLLEARYPRRYFYAADQRHWFIPRELRDVRWDREDDDGISAHPAGVSHRAALREQSLGGGYGIGPVLSGRLRPEHLADIGPLSISSVAHGATAVGLGLTRSDRSATLIALSTGLADDEIRRVHAAHAEGGARCVWLTHPVVWTGALAEDIPWVPAGTTERGWPYVLVEGLGAFRLREFAQHIIDEEPRLADGELRQRAIARFAR
jgi:hypothetical protein